MNRTQNHTQKTPSPDWFNLHIDSNPSLGSIEVAGGRIAYRHWQRKGSPGLLFVHGHAAHSRWWDFIAPAFRDDYDVIAIDLSGAGDSAHRDEYSATCFAKEIVTVIQAASLQSTTVVGHSFGGTMARIAAYLYPEDISGLILVDSAIPVQHGSRTPPAMPRLKDHSFPTLAEGMRRFRLRPSQPSENQYIIDYIAAHSLIESPSGFRFKLDPAVFAKMTSAEEFPSGVEMIRQIDSPTALIYGRKSPFFSQKEIAHLSGVVRDDLIIAIDNAYHHVFLDQPLQFISALEQLLARMSRLLSERP